MSYEIYTKIKQLPDGTFQCTSSSNNVYPRDYSTWIMDYYNNKYPEFSNDEKRAAWLLQSIGNGDKFYPNNWKADQELVREFAKAKGITPSDLWHCARDDEVKFCIYVQAFLDFKRNYKNNNEAYKVKLNSYGKYYYVSKITNGSRRSRVRFAYDESKAKVFKGSLDRVKQIFNAFEGDNDSYKPVYELVTE